MAYDAYSNQDPWRDEDPPPWFTDSHVQQCPDCPHPEGCLIGACEKEEEKEED